MSVCHICGNEISKAEICPFCGAEQEVSRAPKPRNANLVRTVMLKQDQPTVDEAIGRLSEELAAARKSGVKVVRLIHGYGSSGVGGAIKGAVIRNLKTLKERGLIANYMTGEQHFEFGARQNYLLTKYPELQETWKQDRGNKGITFVEL